MVRPGRERLRGAVEVDEAYWGAPEEGAVGRLTEDKALIAVAVEEDRDGIGRIRLHRIPNLTRATLHDFIAQSIEPGSTVRTDGLPAYLDLVGYVHDRKVQRDQPKGEHLLPRAHRVISLFKRWLMGTHQGAIGHDHLDDYLNEFVFRFNRRKSASRYPSGEGPALFVDSAPNDVIGGGYAAAFCGPARVQFQGRSSSIRLAG
jgi:transposase-like protein